MFLKPVIVLDLESKNDIHDIHLYNRRTNTAPLLRFYFRERFAKCESVKSENTTKYSIVRAAEHCIKPGLKEEFEEKTSRV